MNHSPKLIAFNQSAWIMPIPRMVLNRPYQLIKKVIHNFGYCLKLQGPLPPTPRVVWTEAGSELGQAQCKLGLNFTLIFFRFGLVELVRFDLVCRFDWIDLVWYIWLKIFGSKINFGSEKNLGSIKIFGLKKNLGSK